LEAVLEVPPEDCFRIIHVLPPDRFIHTRATTTFNSSASSADDSPC
jgi:hypothetical protein